MRRPQALDAAAFLIDKNRHVGLANGFAQCVGQGTDLITIFDVARKQDKPERIGFTQEALFPIAEFRSRDTKNAGTWLFDFKAGQ